MSLDAQPSAGTSLGQHVSYVDTGHLGTATLFDLAFETNGVVWIATSDGLRRYDGFHWTIFGTNHGLPSSFVRTVTMTPQGVLWVGTDRGAGTFDGTRFNLAAPTNLLAGPSVRRIRPQSDGSIWFCSDKWPDASYPGGLTLLTNGQWIIYREKEGLPSEHVYNFLRDSQGRGFVLTDRGVAQARGQGWKQVITEPVWDLVETAELGLVGFSAVNYYSLERDEWIIRPYPPILKKPHPPKSLGLTSRGEILAYGFGRWNGQAFEPIGPISMTDVVPESIREAPDGALWCLDLNMLVRWQPHSGSWIEYTNAPPPRFASPSGELWLISPSASWRLKGEEFTPVPELAGEPGMMEMDREEGIWAWTTNWIRYYHRGQLQVFAAAEAGLSQVEGAVKDGLGRMWFYGMDAATNRWLAWREAAEWRKRKIELLKNRRLFMADGDPKRGAWFSASDPSGLGWFVFASPEAVVPHRWPAKARRREETRLLVDYETNLWAYGEWGLVLTTGRQEGKWQGIDQLKTTMVLDACASPEGAWFIFSGMQGGKSGLGSFRQGQWRQVDAQVPLWMERTESGRKAIALRAHPGRKKALCFGGYNALYLIPNGDIREFQKITMPEGRSMPISIVQDTSGVLWMGAQRADNQPCLLRFHSDGIPPKAIITAAPKQVSPDGLWQVKVSAMERFSLDSERREFRFSWQFDDQPWTRFGELPAEGLSTLGLKPGVHRFRVRARDEGRDTQTDPTEVLFTVLSPPLQEQWWFQAAAWTGGLSILALGLIAAEKARKLTAVNAVMRDEAEVRRRAEESLQQAQAELRLANQQLETRVQERTSELAKANLALRQEIEERQRIEETQRQLEARMRQTQKLESLGVLAGGIAHDFNNMLTTILGNAELALMDLPSDGSACESLRQIVAASRRAADLCQQMLAYSGRGRFIIEPIHLSHLVRETAQMLEVSLSKKVRLEMNLSSDLPLVDGDATQLRQVVLNLVMNASEAIGDREGLVRISTCTRHFDQASWQGSITQDGLAEGEYVVLEVQDNGCGMDVDTRQRMFDPFFTTKFTGRGLGLAAVLGIIRGHKGAIHVQSEPGQGTAFTIRIPPSKTSCLDFSAQPSKAALHPSPLRKGTLLLVDDETSVRLIARRILERLGFNVLEARDGLEAVDLFRKRLQEIDGVLLDLTMPRLNGVETFRELRLIRPDVRAVLASGYSEHDLSQRFGQDGLAGFVEKPYTVESLAAVLDRVLQASPST